MGKKKNIMKKINFFLMIKLKLKRLKSIKKKPMKKN